jgi:HD domain
MADVRIRQQIALEAARLMYQRVETEYYTAKRKAARLLRIEHRFKPGDLPSNAEIRDQIQVFARLHEGEKRKDNLRSMRIEALALMRKLVRFRPRLIGSVWTGHVRKGSDIDIHIFSNSQDAVTRVLDEYGLEYDVERKRIVKFHEQRVFTHIHVFDRFKFELTLYGEDKVNYPFRSSITGKPIEKGSIAELEAALRAERPEEDLDDAVECTEEHIDRFELYRLLLQPLERTKQSPKYHPEGDVLYHTLQVFELARNVRPYDEEFLLAALLHDVGKGIDPSDHVKAGLDALEGAITDRTRFLIEHHMDALAYRDGTLSARARKRLQSSDDFEDLMLLRELDSKGRVSGTDTCTIADALEYIRAVDLEAYLDRNGPA